MNHDPNPAHMKTVETIVQRRPLLVLMLIFNTLGQAAVIGPILLNHHAGTNLPIEVLQALSLILFLLLPALFVMRAAHGRERLRALLRDVVRFDVPLRWYLLPLIAVPALGVAATFAAPDGGFHLDTVLMAYVTGFLPTLALQFATTNWWEETVWTGVVQKTLQDRHGLWRGTLLTTPLFALEHLFLAFDVSPGQGVVLLAVLTVFLVPVRALFIWIYNCTGSLALAGLTHAASNAVGVGFVHELYGKQGDGVLPLVLLGLLATVATRARLGLRARGTRTPPARSTEAPTPAPDGLEAETPARESSQS